MPAIQYEGKTYVMEIIRYRCLLCHTLAQSASTRIHEIVSCQCGQLSIDGGITAGGTINGDPAKMENLSDYRMQGDRTKRLPLSVLAERHARVVSRIGLR
jgi:hypothetical protein